MNITFNIEVRGRPVQHPVAQYFATHCYLALLNQNGDVVDTLSFDPNNSVGWCDADPTNYYSGHVSIQNNCAFSTWEALSDAFKRWAQRRVYVLGNHNCCHAVMGALVGTNLTGARDGIHFARTANNTWHDINKNLQAEEFIKKNV